MAIEHMRSQGPVGPVGVIANAKISLRIRDTMETELYRQEIQAAYVGEILGRGVLRSAFPANIVRTHP